jgi:hypothetical protein
MDVVRLNYTNGERIGHPVEAASLEYRAEPVPQERLQVPSFEIDKMVVVESHFLLAFGQLLVSSESDRERQTSSP